MKFIILSVVYCRTNSKLFQASAFHRWRWNRAEFSSNNFFTGQKNNYPFKSHLLSGQGTDCTSWAQSVFPNMGFGWAECYNPKWAPVRQPSWGQPGELCNLIGTQSGPSKLKKFNWKNGEKIVTLKIVRSYWGVKQYGRVNRRGGGSDEARGKGTGGWGKPPRKRMRVKMNIKWFENKLNFISK